MRLWAIVVLVVVCVAGVAYGEIPEMMGYQGRITDNVGNPVADGTYTMRFAIYDQLVGGSPEWDSGDLWVNLSGGVFSVMLGGPGQPTLDVPFDKDYWLQVGFNGQIQSPRRRLASVGYAYMASGLVPGTEVSGSVTGTPYAAIKGTNTATEYITYGLYGVSASTSGRGVTGLASATAGLTHGVFGSSASTGGHGVYGIANAAEGSTYGVHGVVPSTGGVAVYGQASAGTGLTRGVLGIASSTSGKGVHGVADAATGGTYGVYGSSLSPSGTGVYGGAIATTGSPYGVHGKSAAPSGRGVYGEATSTTSSNYGVYGMTESPTGRGVYGWATDTLGDNIGVYGRSASADGIGVLAHANADSGSTCGLYATALSMGGMGVCGYHLATDGGIGVFGRSDGTIGRGVEGYARATTGPNYGVYGRTESTDGYGVFFSGGLAGIGTKSCVVRTTRGPTLLYCQESPECWFEDFGEAQLMNGEAHIELDPLFLETVTIDADNPMHVFLQPYDEGCVGLLVERGTAGFDVVNPADPMASGTFSYRVVAKRKGYETERLDVCEAARSDPSLYPELAGTERERMAKVRERFERSSREEQSGRR